MRVDITAENKVIFYFVYNIRMVCFGVLECDGVLDTDPHNIQFSSHYFLIYDLTVAFFLQ